METWPFFTPLRISEKLNELIVFIIVLPNVPLQPYFKRLLLVVFCTAKIAIYFVILDLISNIFYVVEHKNEIFF